MYILQIMAALSTVSDLDGQEQFFTPISSPNSASSVTPMSMNSSTPKSIFSTPKSQNTGITSSPFSPSRFPSNISSGSAAGSPIAGSQKPKLQQTKMSLASLRDQLRAVTEGQKVSEQKNMKLHVEKSGSSSRDQLRAVARRHNTASEQKDMSMNAEKSSSPFDNPVVLSTFSDLQIAYD